MNSSSIALVLGVAAAVTSMSSNADDHRKKARDSHRIGSGMQAIANGAPIGQPGYRWRYFADARKGRAVAINPKGDYFYSDGDGLTLVFKGSAHPNAG